MRTPFQAMIICLAGVALLSVSCDDSSIKPLDYSQAENWMIQSPIKHEVDLFFIYPTSVDDNCTSFVSPVDSVMKAKGVEVGMLYGKGLWHVASIFPMPAEQQYLDLFAEFIK